MKTAWTVAVLGILLHSAVNCLPDRNHQNNHHEEDWHQKVINILLHKNITGHRTTTTENPVDDVGIKTEKENQISPDLNKEIGYQLTHAQTGDESILSGSEKKSPPSITQNYDDYSGYRGDYGPNVPLLAGSIVGTCIFFGLVFFCVLCCCRAAFARRTERRGFVFGTNAATSQGTPHYGPTPTAEVFQHAPPPPPYETRPQQAWQHEHHRDFAPQQFAPPPFAPQHCAPQEGIVNPGFFVASAPGQHFDPPPKY